MLQTFLQLTVVFLHKGVMIGKLSGMLTRTSFRIQGQGQGLGLHYQGQGQGHELHVQGQGQGLIISSCQGQGQGHCFLKDFCRLSFCFIIYHTRLYRPKIISSPLSYYDVKKTFHNFSKHTMMIIVNIITLCYKGRDQTSCFPHLAYLESLARRLACPPGGGA